MPIHELSESSPTPSEASISAASAPTRCNNPRRTRSAEHSPPGYSRNSFDGQRGSFGYSDDPFLERDHYSVSQQTSRVMEAAITIPFTPPTTSTSQQQQKSLLSPGMHSSRSPFWDSDAQNGVSRDTDQHNPPQFDSRESPNILPLRKIDRSLISYFFHTLAPWVRFEPLSMQTTRRLRR